MGYAQAKEYLDKRPLEGEKMDVSSTANQEPQYIYSFRAIFSGKVEWSSKLQEIKFAVFFRFSEFQDFNFLESYSSLILKNGNEDIPTFQSQISNSKVKGGNLLIIKSRILIDYNLHTIEYSIMLTTYWEILFGLSFKQISFRLYDENNKLKVDGILYQSILDRFKSLYYSTLTSILPRKGGIKKFLSVIKNFIAYEI